MLLETITLVGVWVGFWNVMEFIGAHYVYKESPKYPLLKFMFFLIVFIGFSVIMLLSFDAVHSEVSPS